MPPSKEPEWPDEKSYRGSHSCIDCKRQGDPNSVREETECRSRSEVDAKAGPLSNGESRQSRRRTGDSGLRELT